ncbi:hypothetical protein GSI_00030 [Ganoderma sinense ZZ0214-1]|uniref:Uncharacterized protein n=1 Tax=Ganoderma sinense ZZ0214-1 TaxID=1077348 RepID=A0A2G8SRH2_9APHY|nr:hypothetical protein GSI_00030 [Ganoderma sinense ZZ0214-1]
MFGTAGHNPPRPYPWPRCGLRTLVAGIGRRAGGAPPCVHTLVQRMAYVLIPSLFSTSFAVYVFRWGVESCRRDGKTLTTPPKLCSCGVGACGGDSSTTLERTELGGLGNRPVGWVVVR